MHKFTKLNYEILIPRYRAGVLETQIFSAVNQTNSALAGGATLVAVAFSLSTFDRWHRRNQPHELAWTIAMALFTIGSAALWWAEATGWSMFAFRVFFLAGAVLNVAWLALGTIYLLVNKKIADHLRTALTVLSAFSAGVIMVAPTKREIIDGEFPAARELFGVLPRIMAAVGSGVPALVIIVGAIWSTWRVLKFKAPNLKSASIAHGALTAPSGIRQCLDRSGHTRSLCQWHSRRPSRQRPSFRCNSFSRTLFLVSWILGCN